MCCLSLESGSGLSNNEMCYEISSLIKAITYIFLECAK